VKRRQATTAQSYDTARENLVFDGERFGHGRYTLSPRREITMRFKSKAVRGIQVCAVSGTNVASFGIRASEAARKGLLGFAVRHTDVEAEESH
jgi:hypothetical protein